MNRAERADLPIARDTSATIRRDVWKSKQTSRTPIGLLFGSTICSQHCEMGKVIRDEAASDSSEEEGRKPARAERKSRTKKKKKCKKDLKELQRRLLKSKRNQETKIDGKAGKAGNSRKASNRILPRPLVGIYRNGAAGKLIKRSQAKEPLNDINNARRQGNVYKLLNNCDSESDPIIIEDDTERVSKDPLLDSTVKNILQPTPLNDKSLSPILGKVDGEEQCPRKESTENSNPLKIFDFPEKPRKNKKPINIDKCPSSVIKKYEELCNVVSAENFEGNNFADFPIDPLAATKRKLRRMYAESFHSQCLRDMIKRGTVLNETIASTSKSNPLDAEYCPSDQVSVTVEKPGCQAHQRKEKSLPESQNIFVIPEKYFDFDSRKNEAPPNLLFDLSLLNPSSSGAKNVESDSFRETNNSTDITTNNRANNYCKKDNNSNYFEAAASTHANKMERAKEKNEPPLFVPTEAQLPVDLINKKHLKRKNHKLQMIHLMKHATKRHPGRGNLKMPQQVKMEGVKHVPAILRRRNRIVDSNSRLNLFDPSMHINKKPQEVHESLFSPQSLKTDLNENSRKVETASIFDPTDMNVQACVMASPSIRKEEARFKSFCGQPELKAQPQRLNPNELFLGKKNINPPVQKTIMFTKKDSRNIGHCLHLNTLITDRNADNSNVCLMRRSISTDQERLTKNASQRNCQRCYRYSEGSDGSYYCSQESNASQMQNAEVHQKPVVCEKVLLRRVQHPHPNHTCHNDQHVCYVVVDPDNVHECSNDNVPCQKEKHRTMHSRRFCQEDVPDIGILKGVQNLQILPVEEHELQTNYTSNQCAGRNTVMLEEQPVKYLAVENNSRTQKIPIYMQSNKRVTSVDNVEVINPNVGYRVVSCPQESAQKVIFVPACEQNKVVYGKQENLPSSYEESPRARKVILCRPEYQPNLWCVKDPSNVCGVHVPKQNFVEIRNTERDAIGNNLQGDAIKHSRRGTINWDDLHCQSNHEYQRVNDSCARNHAIFYKK